MEMEPLEVTRTEHSEKSQSAYTWHQFGGKLSYCVQLKLESSTRVVDAFSPLRLESAKETIDTLTESRKFTPHLYFSSRSCIPAMSYWCYPEEQVNSR